MSSIYRSDERDTSYLFRMSRADKQRLKTMASEAGLSIQAYLEYKALGYENPIERPSGRPRRHEEELPLTG